MNNNFVSIIIPVYNDFERLKLCLDALENQTYPENLYEVIVVDNNSVPKITSKSLVKYPHVKLEHEQKQSSYAARNKGISVAKGEIIGFTDSDCIPANDWIEKGVEHLQNNPDCGLVGGRIDVFPEDPKKPTAVELWEMENGFPHKEQIEKEKVAVTANFFTYKNLILKMGMFDSDFYSGGDKLLTHKIYLDGNQLEYTDYVVIMHPARGTLRELCNTRKRYIKGAYELSKKYNISTMPARKKLFFDLIPPLFSFFKMICLNHSKNGQCLISRFKTFYVYTMLRYFTVLEISKLYLYDRIGVTK